MASLELDPASGHFRVRFRFGGRAFKQSLRTKHRRVAAASLGQVEETLRMLELGLTQVPEGVDEGAFIVSGARRVASKGWSAKKLRRVGDTGLEPVTSAV